MGYYTRYELSFHEVKHGVMVYNGANKEIEKQVLGHLTTICPDVFDGLTSIGELPDDVCKWYSHDEDMLDLSRRMPNYVFTLSGEGEEFCDLWETHYLNGKVQHCPAEIIYPVMDLNELLS